MKRLLQPLFLFATLTVCSNTSPSGPSNDATDAVASARQPGPKPGPKPGPPPAAGQPAELTIVKTAVSGDVAIQAGDPAAFDIRVANNGPGTAVDVHLTDNLPMLGSTWTVIVSAGESVYCQFIGPTTSLFCGSTPGTPYDPPLPQVDLDPGEFFSVRVSSPTDESVCGTVTNSATASADNAPGVTDSASVVVICPPPPPQPELQIVKTGFPDDHAVNPGDPFWFDITVTNNGPGTATRVFLTDILPPAVYTTNYTAEQTAGDVSVHCEGIGSTLLCGIFASGPGGDELGGVDMEPGQTYMVRITSPNDQGECGIATNTASVTADNASEVSDSGSVTVICPPQ